MVGTNTVGKATYITSANGPLIPVVGLREVDPTLYWLLLTASVLLITCIPLITLKVYWKNIEELTKALFPRQASAENALYGKARKRESDSGQ